jgi:hypothetical protein
MFKLKVATLVCLLLLGSTYASALDEPDSHEEKFTDTKQQESPALLQEDQARYMNVLINQSINQSIYLQMESIPDKGLIAEESLKGNSSTKSTIIALSAIKNNKYVKVTDGGILWNDYLTATGSSIGKDERFELIDMGDNKVAFKAASTGGYVVYNLWFSTGYIFTKEFLIDGTWALRIPDNRIYVSVDGYQLTLKTIDKKDKLGPSEKFKIEIQDESIQKAIDAANTNDTIELKAGIYKQKETVKIDKSVKLVGTHTGETFVEGDKNGSVFSIVRSNNDTQVGLAYLSIMGGLSGEYGGAIDNIGGKLSLIEIGLVKNKAKIGGAIANRNGGKIATYLLYISDNEADYGGGIYNQAGSILIMDIVKISSNTANIKGGAIFGKGKLINNESDTLANIPDGTVEEEIPEETKYVGATRPAGSSPAALSTGSCGTGEGSCDYSPCPKECPNCKLNMKGPMSITDHTCMKPFRTCCEKPSYDCTGRDIYGCPVCKCI